MKKLLIALALCALPAHAGTFNFLNKLTIPITVGIMTEFTQPTQLVQPNKTVLFDAQTNTINTIFWVVETQAVYDVAGNIVKPYFKEDWQAAERVGPVDFEGVATIYPNGKYDFQRIGTVLPERNKQAIKKPIDSRLPGSIVKVATNISIGPDIFVKPRPLSPGTTGVPMGMGAIPAVGFAESMDTPDIPMNNNPATIQDTPQDVEMARANASEDARGLFERGMQAKKDKNYILARTVFEQAMLEPIPTAWGVKAHYELSDLYERGLGVVRNPQKADQLIKQAQKAQAKLRV